MNNAILQEIQLPDKQTRYIKNIYWMSTIRTTTSLVILTFILASYLIFYFADLPPDTIPFFCRDMLGWLLMVVLFEIFVNRPYKFILKRVTNIQNLALVQSTIDALLISVFVYLMGGIDFPLSVLVYFFGITFAGVAFQRWLGYWLATISALSYAFVILGQLWGWIPVIRTTYWDLNSLEQIFLVLATVIFLFLAVRLGDVAVLWLNDSIEKLNRAITALTRSHNHQQALLQALEQSEQEYRQISELAQESEGKLRSIIASMDDLLFTLDTNGIFLDYYQPAGMPGLYVPSEQFLGKSIREVMPARVAELAEATINAVATGSAPRQFDYALDAPEGTMWFSAKVSRRLDSGDEFTGVTVVVRDITERVKAKESLLESEEKYRLVVENTHECILVIQDGKAKFANAKTEEVFGYTSQEAANKSFIEFIHPDDKNVVLKRHIKRLKGETLSPSYEFRIVDKSGETKWMEINVVTITWEGRPAFLSFLRDITEHKRADTQIKASLQEKEVLLKEIHHRVKNNLQVISSLLNWQAGYVKDPQALEAFRDSQHRIRSMALIHEKLYQSHNLAQIDFEEYLNSLLLHLFHSLKTSSSLVRLKIAVEDIHLGIDVAVPCGLIINELVSNSLKHAFPDRREGEVIVESQVNSEGQLSLIIGDNGIGFPANLNFRDVSSLGLQLVGALVGQLEGTIELDRSTGTEFKITFAL